jgi:predicted transglutaminase-like cysteine proteinase
MVFVEHVHALRAATVACGLVWLTVSASATTPQSLGLLDHPTEAAEPFGLAVSTVDGGGLVAKWRGVSRKIDDERVQLALCDGDREGCASDAALQLLAIVDSGRLREGRARLGEINRAINLAIRATSDLAQFGEIDVWSSPLVTFYRGAGDCEDYAIAKFLALQMAGVSADDLRIIVMADTVDGEGHAVAAARLDGRWLILDNRRMTMVEDANIRNYRPLFVIDQSSVRRYSETPLVANTTNHNAAPATALNPSSLTVPVGASN